MYLGAVAVVFRQRQIRAGIGLKTIIILQEQMTVFANDLFSHWAKVAKKRIFININQPVIFKNR